MLWFDTVVAATSAVVASPGPPLVVMPAVSCCSTIKHSVHICFSQADVHSSWLLVCLAMQQQLVVVSGVLQVDVAGHHWGGGGGVLLLNIGGQVWCATFKQSMQQWVCAMLLCPLLCATLPTAGAAKGGCGHSLVARQRNQSSYSSSHNQSFEIYIYLYFYCFYIIPIYPSYYNIFEVLLVF